MPSFLTYDNTKTLQFGLPMGHSNGWGNAVNPNIALGQIAHDLPDISDGVASTFKSQDLSMPSPWAKFIAFETVLYDDNNTYGGVHEQAVSDWRSLLTIIALSEVIGLNVNIDQKVNLSQDGNNFTKRFYNDVRQVYPQNSIFSYGVKPVEWDVFIPMLIKSDSQLIGFLSNSTLVCPPYSYSPEAKIELSKYAFFNQQRFIDPVPWINQDADRAYVMKLYLDYLHANVALLSSITTEPINVTMCQKVNKLIDDFRRAIVPQMQQSNINVTNVGNVLTSVSLLMNSIKVTLPIPQSDVCLKSAGNDGSKLYIVGNSVFGIEANRDQANNINVIGNQKLSHLSPTFRSGDRFYGSHQLAQSEEIYRDSDLLLDKLYLVDTQKSIVNHGEDVAAYSKTGNKDVIWPINEVLLKYLTVDEIRKNIDITYDNNETYTVSLTLLLAKQPHTFVKKYTGNNVIIKPEDHMPYIAVWPYIKAVHPGENQKNVWKSYYVFKSSYEASSSITTEVGCDEPVTPTINRLDLISNASNVNIFSEYSQIPTHIKVTEKQGHESHYCGAVLLSTPPEKVISEHSSWTVGVDFGTTSSAAYYKMGGGNDFITFGTQHWNAFDSASGLTKKEVGEHVDSGLFVAMHPFNMPYNGINFFLPNSYLKRTSYPTIYEMLTSHVPSGTDTTFTYGHIPYDYATGDTRADKTNTIVYDDLKWSYDPKVREAAKKYLHQLLVQIMYVAAQSNVGSIHWKFSYPTALSRDLLTEFKRNTNNILGLLEKTTGIKSTVDSDSYYPESIVAAEYFQRVHNVGTVACVDIGGGTTDISIWKRELTTENLLQTSVKLASRDIFLSSFWKLLREDETMHKNTLSLKPKVKDYVEMRKNLLSEEELPKVEGILFEFEQAVSRYGGVIGDVKNKKQFERTLSFGLFAILYYTMDALAMVKDKFDSNQRSISICIGGNGARLIDWLPEGYLKDIEDILKEYLAEEHGFNISINIRYDKGSLKTEASKGLLLVEEGPRVFERNLKLPASEKLTVTKYDDTTETIESDVDIMQRPDIRDFFDTQGKSAQVIEYHDQQMPGIKRVEINRDLSSVRRVLKYFNKLNSVFDDRDYLLSYSEADFDSIHEQMQYALNDAAKHGRLDPAFVLGVKSILKNENR